MADDFDSLSTNEQIRFLIQSQKSLGDNLEKLYETVNKQGEEHARLDQRERQARQALLSGIAAYLRALNGGENQNA